MHGQQNIKIFPWDLRNPQ